MITAELDMAPLVRKLRQLGHATRQPMEQLVREQARLFVSSSGNVPGMVQVTPPFSAGARGTAAKKRGEARIASDISKIYLTPGRAFSILTRSNSKMAAGFWRAVSLKRWTEAARLLRVSGTELAGMSLGSFDGGALHTALRSRANGRVSLRHARMVVVDEQSLVKYIRAKQAKVGTLASGMNRAATALGAKGVPSWVMRHGSRFSSFSIQSAPGSFYIIIGAGVPFAQADTVRRMTYVLQYRSNALTRAMPHIIRKMVRTAGFAAVTT